MNPFSDSFDLCVIGGGINGAGIALDAAMRGLRVSLYEQHDFGFGASTATSKLIHGGLRYLENYQFKLVRESLNERNIIQKNAPHLVKPLQFFLPIYKNLKWKPWKIRLGLSIYDLLNSESVFPNHEMVSTTDVQLNIPWLKMDGLLNTASYYDAQMEDNRIIVELLKMATEEGAQIYNYSSVKSVQFIESQLSIDVINKHNKALSFNTTAAILTTGAWNNTLSGKTIVKPSKGIHIVLPDMDLSVGLLLITPQDKRVFFIMPWNGFTLVGTTDQYEDNANYDNPLASNNDIQYLLEAINHYHTKRIWTGQDILGIFCGYRPLIESNKTQASKQKREETLTWVQPNMLAVSGGKYTTYRHVAEKTIDLIRKNVFPDRLLLPCRTATTEFIGKIVPSDWPSDEQLSLLTHQNHIHRESIIHLIQTYGNLYKEILNIALINKEYAVKFDIEHPMILAELKYSIDFEWVKHPIDFLFRRTYYGYYYGHNRNFISSLVHHFNQMTGQAIQEHDVIEQIKLKTKSIN